MVRLILGVVSLAVLAVGGFLGYRWLTPGAPPPDLAPLERTLADRAVAEVAIALVFPAGVDTVTAPLLEGPKGPELGGLLRARLIERGRHIVEVASLKQEHPSFSRFFEMIAGQGAARWADARWKEAGVHAFVRGRATYADEAGATVCTLEAWLEDSGSGTRLGAPALSRQAIRRSVFDLDYYRLTVAGIGAGWRLLAWVGLLLALPLVTWPLNSRLLSRERNATNLLVWVGYTGVDVAAALALTGFATPGFFGTVALLLALGLSLFYNYGVLSEIEDLRR